VAAETAKETVRRLFAEVLNGGDLDAVDELFGSGCVFHTPINSHDTSAGFKQFISLVRTAFPDVQYEVQDRKSADNGNRVMVRWAAYGTHQGELLGIAPTGRQITVMGLLFVFGHTDVQYTRGGEMSTLVIDEVWADWGGFDLLQQLQEQSSR
jgi:predicted ester cyclase